jgi:hypothetical protein
MKTDTRSQRRKSTRRNADEMMTDKRDHGIRVGLGRGHHVDGAVKVVKESIGIAHIIAIEGIVIVIRTMRVEAENEDVNVIAVVAADVVVTVAKDSRQTDSIWQYLYSINKCATMSHPFLKINLVHTVNCNIFLKCVPRIHITLWVR